MKSSRTSYIIKDIYIDNFYPVKLKKVKFNIVEAIILEWFRREK